MTWNYRLVSRMHRDGSCTFAIHEAYYDEAGRLETVTRDAVEVFGESRREALEDYRAMAEAFRAPVLPWESVPGMGALSGLRRRGKGRRTRSSRRGAGGAG